jgi:1-deoxy-D-xylulose-5-phosphate synthase
MLEIGQSETLREGGDVAIIAYGSMVYPAIEAAENLAKNGIQSTVINARWVKPLDVKMITALAKSKRLMVTVEEAYLAGGFGSAVMECLEANGLLDSVKLVRMGVPDRIVTHGDPKTLLAQFGLDADGIYNKVRETIEILEESRAGKRRFKIVS